MLKEIVRSSVTGLFYHSAVLSGQRYAGVRVLAYHKVNDEAPEYLAVTTERFLDQMSYLADQGYQTIGLEQLLKGDCPERSIVLTFDDGYRDNYENAFPILRNFGFKATVFCVGQRLGAGPYLRRHEMLKMLREGMEFGAHTLTHPRLPETPRGKKWWEIYGSKRFLEEYLGVPCSFFCYPYGAYDEESVHMVKRAGFRAAVSNRPGTNKKINAPLLRRTEISGFDTLDDFQKKLAGAFDLLHQGLHLIRRGA